jgi:8-oxo-dGTP diphosphatase
VHAAGLVSAETARYLPGSGIFGPTTGLDPVLFDGRHELRPAVRHDIMDRLDRALRVDGGLTGSEWEDDLKVYLAGGSASEWAGGRPNDAATDLDILIGVDYDAFRGSQSASERPMDDREIDAALNATLRRRFNDPDWYPDCGGHFDLTGYVNPDAWDIRRIKPYAAWNLSDSRWAVRPPHLPAHSAADFDPAILSQARAVATEARAILRQSEPARTRQARGLWERLHAERRRAFSYEGDGWQDAGNLIEKWLAYAPGDILKRIRELALAPRTAVLAADSKAELVSIRALMPHREYDHGPGYSTGWDGTQYAPKRGPAEWRELVHSIREHGVQQPVRVHYDAEKGTAHLGEGNSRLNAAAEAGHTHIPAVVHPTRYGKEAPRFAVPGGPRELPRHGPDTLRPSEVLPPEYLHDSRTAGRERQYYSGLAHVRDLVPGHATEPGRVSDWARKGSWPPVKVTWGGGENFMIQNGHHRYRAARQLGHDHVEVHVKSAFGPPPKLKDTREITPEEYGRGLTTMNDLHGSMTAGYNGGGPPAVRVASGSDGDRMVTCSKGHEHWGAHGAAGLLMRHKAADGQVRYLLQKRGPDVDHPDTWSIPSGARGKDETPEQGALREFREEMGALPRGTSHRSTVTSTDCGDWKFHTVSYDSPELFTPRGRGETDHEIAGAGWFAPREVKHLDLHPAFAKSWDNVRKSASVRRDHSSAGGVSLDVQEQESTKLEPREGVAGYDVAPRSGMIYLPVPEGLIERVPGGVDDEQHITVVYLGKDLSDQAFGDALEAAARAAAASRPLHGVLHGTGTFPPSEGKTPAFVPAYVPGIGQLRRDTEHLNASEHRDYRPHVTLAYLEDGDPVPPPHPARHVSFTHLHVKRGGQVVRFPLGG